MSKLLISQSTSNQEAVDAINRKLGTNFTVFDYHAWETGAHTEGAEEFSKAVEQFVGAPAYRLVTKLAQLRERLSIKFGRRK